LRQLCHGHSSGSQERNSIYHQLQHNLIDPDWCNSKHDLALYYKCSNIYNDDSQHHLIDPDWCNSTQHNIDLAFNYKSLDINNNDL
jgi:hypothetical protein